MRLRPLVCVATLVICLPTTQPAAQSQPVCWFDSALGIVQITGDNSHATKLTVDSSGRIRVDGVQCDGATVNNTDLIRVGGYFSRPNNLTINNPARFVPGRTPEADGVSEIEMEFSISCCSAGGDEVVLNLTNGPDSLTFRDYNGNSGIDIGEDGDQDWILILPVDFFRVNARSGNDSIHAESYDRSGLTIYGGYGNDVLWGNRFSVVYGEYGDDELLGYRLYGGPGDDFMNGGIVDQGAAPDGADTIIAEVDYSKRVNSVNVSNNDVADDGEAGEGDNVFSAHIIGGAADDVLVGGSSNERLIGGPGNDELYGGDGNDTLIGGEGDDLIFGDAGSDHLYGDEGNDIILAGAGPDELRGGAGNDELRGEAGKDNYSGGDGDDAIFNADAAAEIVDCGYGFDDVEPSGIDTYYMCEDF
jgi:Ca2+-binding RTX toxin-like protein